jgi:hypothetical protein
MNHQRRLSKLGLIQMVQRRHSLDKSQIIIVTIMRMKSNRNIYNRERQQSKMR